MSTIDEYYIPTVVGNSNKGKLSEAKSLTVS